MLTLCIDAKALGTPRSVLHPQMGGNILYFLHGITDLGKIGSPQAKNTREQGTIIHKPQDSASGHGRGS